MSSSESTGRDPLEGQIVAESDSFLIHSQSRSPGSQGTLASVAALVLVYLDVHSSCARARAASPFELVSPHASLARSRPHPLGPPRGGENSEWRRGESRLSVCLSPFLARVSPQISLKCIHLAPFWRGGERANEVSACNNDSGDSRIHPFPDPSFHVSGERERASNAETNFASSCRERASQRTRERAWRTCWFSRLGRARAGACPRWTRDERCTRQEYPSSSTNMATLTIRHSAGSSCCFAHDHPKSIASCQHPSFSTVFYSLLH